MRVDKGVADYHGPEWVAEIAAGMAARGLQEKEVVVDSTHVRVFRRKKLTYNHKTAKPAGGVDTTP